MVEVGANVKCYPGVAVGASTRGPPEGEGGVKDGAVGPSVQSGGMVCTSSDGNDVGRYQGAPEGAAGFV